MDVEIHIDNVFGNYPRAEIDRLLAHQFHQFRAGSAFFLMRGHHLAGRRIDGRVEIGRQIAGGKTGIVFHFGGQGQLTQRQGACHAVFFGNSAFKNQGL